MAEATVYLQVEPVWKTGYFANGPDGLPQLESIKVTKMTQSRPKKISGVGVTLKLRIPDAAFKPLAPTVIIDIPEEVLSYEPEVTVELPDGE